MSQQAVKYSRVSTVEQGEKFSLGAQRDALEAFAIAHEYSIVASFEDKETAKQTGRRAFGEMLVYLATHAACKTILVEKTDRLYRNPVDYAEVYTAIRRLGLTVCLVKENGVLSADALPHEFLMHEVNVAVASYHSRNLSCEIRKGMVAKAKTGAYPSAAPLGYVNTTDDRVGIVPDPTTAPLIRQLFERVGTGESASALTRFAWSIGLKSKKSKRLAKDTVATLLKNPLYVGEFTWGRKSYVGAYEPLVDRALFERVQRALTGRRKSWGGGKEFVFAPSIVTCGVCGGWLSGDEKRKPNGLSYVFYHCNGARNCRRFVPERVFDAQAVKLLQSLHIDETTSDWLLDELDGWHGKSRGEDAVTAGRWTTQLTRLKTERVAAFRRVAVGEITEAFWKEVQEVLDREIAEAEAGLAAASTGGVSREVFRAAAAKPIELLQAAPELWVSQSPTEKGKLMKTMVSNFVVNGETLTPNWRLPFDVLARGAESREWWS